MDHVLARRALIAYASRIPAPPIWTDEPLGTDEKDGETTL